MLPQGETIQSQYSASPAIKALAESARVRIAPDADIDLFYRMIFDIDTAQGVGLDIWGRILGIGRNLEVEETGDWFGFNRADYEPFDQDVFYDGVKLTNLFRLTDNAYRSLLLWKAMANIACADAATLNNLLQGLFPGENIAVYETGVMAIELYIYFPLEPWQRALLREYGLLARGAGVGFKWVEIPYPVFGFAEADYDPFDTSPFWEPGYIS